MALLAAVLISILPIIATLYIRLAEPSWHILTAVFLVDSTSFSLEQLGVLDRYTAAHFSLFCSATLCLLARITSMAYFPGLKGDILYCIVAFVWNVWVPNSGTDDDKYLHRKYQRYYGRSVEVHAVIAATWVTFSFSTDRIGVLVLVLIWYHFYAATKFMVVLSSLTRLTLMELDIAMDEDDLPEQLAALESRLSDL